MQWIGLGLFWLNVAFFAVLAVLYLLRAVWYWDRVAADLSNHGRGVGYFTVIAATNVLGIRYVLIADSPRAAAAIWFVGIGLWLVVTYTVFTALTVKQDKPSLAEGINGGWLVAVVAAQSVAILGGLDLDQFPEQAELVSFFILAMWLGGGMLYVWLISLADRPGHLLHPGNRHFLKPLEQVRSRHFTEGYPRRLQARWPASDICRWVFREVHH